MLIFVTGIDYDIHMELYGQCRSYTCWQVFINDTVKPLSFFLYHTLSSGTRGSSLSNHLLFLIWFMKYILFCSIIVLTHLVLRDGITCWHLFINDTVKPLSFIPYFNSLSGTKGHLCLIICYFWSELWNTYGIVQ